MIGANQELGIRRNIIETGGVRALPVFLYLFDGGTDIDECLCVYLRYLQTKYDKYEINFNRIVN